MRKPTIALIVLFGLFGMAHADMPALLTTLDTDNVPVAHMAAASVRAVLVDAAAPLAGTFRVDIDETRALTARVERVARHPAVPDAATYAGTLDDGGSFVLVDHAGAFAGSFMTVDGLYQLRPVEPGLSALIEIDQTVYPEHDCGTDEGALSVEDFEDAARERGDKITGGEESEDGETIDVMVVYTASAVEKAGDIDAEILAAVEQTNTAYANSEILQRLRLVHTQQVAYQEIGQMWLDLFLVNFPFDGVMDEVWDWRDQYGADLVSLWVGDGGDLCGIANILYFESPIFQILGYSVTAVDCAVGNVTFAHELGHNMGARHDEYVDPTVGSPYAYNHGYIDLSVKRRTVMAYNDRCSDAGFNCSRWLNFSNPNITEDGVVTGTTQTNDNARTLNNTAPIVAAYRTSVVVTTTTTTSTTTTTTSDGETTTTTQPPSDPEPFDDADSADGDDDDDDSGCGC